MLQPSVMEWTRFNTRGKDADAAFEALTGQLFERWCRGEHRGALRDVRFVNGRGGDGGVEVVAVLVSGHEIGLQAKWFRDGFGAKQVQQIDRSLRAAIANHPQMVRYVVAIPRNLNDERDAPARQASPKKKREMSERRRWEEWRASVRTIAPRTEIELWDEAKLEGLLSERENEGLHAYWFPDSVIAFEDIQKQFKAATDGWLQLRYLPHLHATGTIEEDLSLRLGEPEARARLLEEVEGAKGELTRVRDDVERLACYPTFMGAPIDGGALRLTALLSLKKLIHAADELIAALRIGRPIERSIPFGQSDEDVLRRLHDALTRLDQHAGSNRAPTHEICKRIQRSLWENQAPLPILRAWNRWRRSACIAAFLGPPGIGKTHGLAHTVASRLESKLPALLIRARDCPLDDGWPGILRRALVRQGASLDELLSALEALAVRAEVQRAERAISGEEANKSLAAEPVCFLLALDGLEEHARRERWGELLRELHLHLQSHPRIRVAVTLRTASAAAILGRMNLNWIDVIRLPSDGGDVQRLLVDYCREYGVALPDRRLRWAIRDPLSVRLFCQLARDLPRWAPDRSALSLPRLLRKRLDHAEEALRERGSISDLEAPLHAALNTVVTRCLERGAVPREEAIDAVSAAFRPKGRFTPEQWSWVFDEAAVHGLLLTSKEEPEQLRQQSISYVEPAFEPLMDYLVAEQACEQMVAAIDEGRRPALDSALRDRSDALEQAAILLAQRGVDLVAAELWKRALPADQRESLVLRAISALEGQAAHAYASWVRDRLLVSMPSCRRVLAELCIPVARDEEHPFGPRFVHETLRPFLPAKRDLFWSGPRDLPGDGEHPWEGLGSEALERLTLEPDDRAEGPPLLLAWALTSVDTQWRRRVRRELAGWGSRDLDELVRWLDLVMETNDPQMAEDVAMIAFGAACLAGSDPKLARLSEWADAHLLAPDGPHRREDILVLHAARGIVERARVMGATVTPSALERAHQLYSTEPKTLPIDAAAAKDSHRSGHYGGHYGVPPITGDLAWYVLPQAIRSFFTERDYRLDSRAEEILSVHAPAADLEKLTPQEFAFGVVAAHLHAAGWNREEHFGTPRGGAHGEKLGMDVAIVRQYRPQTHGARSPVCSLAEKYVWTGCHALQAYLAGRVPLHADSGPAGWVEPPVDPVLVSSFLPNPASDVLWTDDPAHAGPWVFWADGGVIAPITLESKNQADRAIEWVRRAPAPDLIPWMQFPRSVTPKWAASEEWLVLRCLVIAREEESQAESILKLSTAALSKDGAVQLVRTPSPDGRLGDYEFSEFQEGVRGRTYVDPCEAVWAPWATGVEGKSLLLPRRPSRNQERHEVIATVARLHWDDAHGEKTLWLPAHWLRCALGLVDTKRIKDPTGDEWRFLDRSGKCHAVFTSASSGPEQLEFREALLIRRSSMESALRKQGLTMAWGGWLFREPSTTIELALRDERSMEDSHVRRQWRWIGLLSPDGVDVHPLPRWAEIEGTAEPAFSPPAQTPEEASLVAVGSTNPSFATPLRTDLDDEDAVPYFLWDDPMTVGEVRHYLATASPPERERLLGKILREARDPDVWRFTTPAEVAARFDALSRHLGRRRGFWKFLLDSWEKEALLVEKSA